MTDNISELRNQIAQSIRAVRLACFGRKCLGDCQRRMATAAPCRRATRKRWGAAVAAALVCLGAFAQGVEGNPGITCVWVEEHDGVEAHYDCSGYGSTIFVRPGGSSSSVVTNAFGSCTNCVAISPELCAEIQASIIAEASDVLVNAASSSNSVAEVLGFIDSSLSDLRSFRRFDSDYGDPPGLSSATSVAFTNYVSTVNNSQTYLVREYPAYSVVTSSARNRGRAISYNNGIYDYSRNVIEQELYYQDLLQSSLSKLSDVDERTRDLRNVANNMNCDSCTSGDGSGDGGSCDSCSGEWCTEEQGDAIITLLEDTKDYVARLGSLVLSISNNVAVSVQTLHDGLFTSYDHIPTESELGSTWQELYLSGGSGAFPEYASTNILARIELLLAGISGVLTNADEYVGPFEDSDYEQYVSEVRGSLDVMVEDVGSAVNERERNVRSVGDALIGLYTAFRGWSGTPFSRETIINSYSVELGENRWDVPNFEPSETGLAVANLIRVVCRSVMSVIYILFTILVFVRFHIAYFQWVLKYLRWAVELAQGLFA